MNLKKWTPFIVISIIVVIIFILVFPVLINFTLMSWSSNYMFGTSRNWMSFIATYYSALIGGIASGALTLLGVLYSIRASFNGIRMSIDHEIKEKNKDQTGVKLNHLYKVKKTIYKLDAMLSARNHGWNENREKDDLEEIDNAIREFILPKLNELLEVSASVDWDFFNEIKEFVDTTRKLVITFNRVDLDKLGPVAHQLCENIEKKHENRLIKTFKRFSSE